MSDVIVTRLAEYIANQTRVPLSADVSRAAKRCLVDWTAAATAGHDQPLTQKLQRAVAPQLDVGDAELIPTGRRALPNAAALINAASAHVMEFDDIYRDALYHPGAPVIAAALAAAQHRQLDGARLLNAIVCGYEVSNRIGVAVNPAHYRYWHTTATVGTIGAAAAAASALGLDETATAHALANATTFAAGLQQAFRSDAMTKPLHVGRAAENGYFAASTAAEGITGAAGMLDGELGFATAMGGGGGYDEVIADLGQRFTIVDTTQKNHGCCGHCFASIDAVRDLQAKHGFDSDAIASIRIGTYQAALDITGRIDPATAMEARFSTPWCVSAALVLGSVRLAAFSPQALANASIRALAKKVAMHVDESIDARFPYRRQSEVAIQLEDGRVFAHFSATRKGDPENPLTDAELNEKFAELASPYLSVQKTRRICDTLWNIDTRCDLLRVVAGSDD